MYQGTRWVILKQEKRSRKSHAWAPLRHSSIKTDRSNPGQREIVILKDQNISILLLNRPKVQFFTLHYKYCNTFNINNFSHSKPNSG